MGARKKPLPMVRFRNRYWATEFIKAAIARFGKLSRDKLDEMLLAALGKSSRAERPRIIESLMSGRVLSRRSRRLSVEDFVRAGTIVLRTDRLERMYFSPMWSLVLPETRTLRVVEDGIARLLKPAELIRLTACESERIAKMIPDLTHLTRSASERHIPRLEHYQAMILRRLTRQGRLDAQQATILRVLLHQEAWLACHTRLAEKHFASTRAAAIRQVQQLFGLRKNQFSNEIRLFERSLFYPNGNLEVIPAQQLHASRFVAGLIVQSLPNARARSLNRAKEVWAAVNPYPAGYRSGIAGSG